MIRMSGLVAAIARTIGATVTAVLHNRIRLLARYRDLARAGVRGDELQQALGIKNPGQLFYLGKEVSLPLVARAADAAAALLEADRGLKGSEPADAVLERLVVRLAGLAQPARSGAMERP